MNGQQQFWDGLKVVRASDEMNGINCQFESERIVLFDHELCPHKFVGAEIQRQRSQNQRCLERLSCRRNWCLSVCLSVCLSLSLSWCFSIYSEGWRRIPFLLSRLGLVRFCSRQTFVYITAFKKNFKCYVRFCLVLHSFHASTLQRKHFSHFCGKTLVIFYFQREKVNASEKNMCHTLKAIGKSSAQWSSDETFHSVPTYPIDCRKNIGKKSNSKFGQKHPTFRQINKRGYC